MHTRRNFLRQMGAAAAAAEWRWAPSRDGLGMLAGRPGQTATGEHAELATVRAQFPALQERMNGHPLVYLDSAATAQRPRAVIDALTDFYLHGNANPSKSLHTLAQGSADRYEKARITVARALNAVSPQEIVWTRGTTEAINLIASSWGSANLQAGDEIVVTVSDHYSCLVPWQLAARRANARVRILDVVGHVRKCDQFGAVGKEFVELI